MVSRQASRTAESASLRRRTTWAMILVRWAAAASEWAAETVARRRRASFLTAGLGSVAAAS